MAERSELSGVQLRRASVADAALLAGLGARTFRETFAAQNSAADMDAFIGTHYSPALQAAELRDASRSYWIAECDGAPAGFLLLRRGETSPGVHGQRPLQLERIYVERRFQGRRVGQRLMQVALSEATRQGHDVLWLGVWERNLAALEFYRRFGFEAAGEMIFTLGSDLQRDLVLARTIAPVAGEIRRATRDDAVLLASLAERTFRDTYGVHGGPADKEAFIAARFSPELQRAELEDPACAWWVAEVDRVAAGFLMLRAGGSAPGVRGLRPVELQRLYVDRLYLGSGLGKMLMLHALNEASARGHDQLWLDVWSGNTRAVTFYERFGFTVAAEIPFMFGTDLQRDFILARPL